MAKNLGICAGLAVAWAVAFATLASAVISLPDRLANAESQAVGQELIRGIGLVAGTFFVSTFLTGLVLSECYYRLKDR